MAGGTAEVEVQAFIDKVNKAYEGSVMERGGRFEALNIRRLSSGILHVDMALGGGWPFGRVVVLAGEYSTGKTLLALKALSEVTKYCHNCHKHNSVCSCGKFRKGIGLFIDMEGAFDLEWAVANGFDDEWHVVARPEYAEQAIDIINDSIRQNVFDLVIVDSIAAMTPTKEIESSTEDWQMGLAARLMNKAMRTWNAALNKMSQDTPSGGPLILCVNQLRDKIGLVFGDPRTMPGGKGQTFCSSVIIYTKSFKTGDDPEMKETSSVELRGLTQKNKTYVPRLEYTFQLALRDTEDAKKGDVDNANQLIKYGKKYGLVKKVGGNWSYDVVAVPTERALLSQLKHKPELATKLWKAIIREACGTTM